MLEERRRVNNHTDIAAGLNRGKAAIEFDRPQGAQDAARCMDGGVLDGEVLKVTVSYVSLDIN
jgi:RNA recognition motif-containing protein